MLSSRSSSVVLGVSSMSIEHVVLLSPKPDNCKPASFIILFRLLLYLSSKALSGRKMWVSYFKESPPFITAHNNVKAFITHCGMSGIYEGLTEGVPMIFTPIFADQRSNAALLKKLGIGLSLDMHSVTKEKLLVALNAIINNTR